MLSRLIVGRYIDEVRAVSGKLQRNGIPGSQGWKPSTVASVTAHGKLIVVRFDDGSALTSTLGMSGWWYPSEEMAEKLYASDKAYQGGKMVLSQNVVKQALKYSRVGLVAGGEPLALFTDMRNFGNMELYPDGISDAKIAEKIGLDLLNELPMLDSDTACQRLLAMKRGATKRLLNMRLGDLALEQSFIAGLGNIYRAEAFWLSGIDPRQRFSELTDIGWLKLCEISMVVLQIAYATTGVMSYSSELIEGCLGVKPPSSMHRGHLAYGRNKDVFGREIVRDDSFNRPLWRLA